MDPLTLEPPETTLPKALKWTLEQSGDTLVVSLQGDIDENANLLELLAVISGPVRFDLGRVRRINSAGVREWVNFIRDAASLSDQMTLANCSPAIVMQMNMISNFRGKAEVTSFYAPLVCPTCDREQDERIELTAEVAAGLPDTLPDFLCSKCDTRLELDDIPERYFAFLKL